MKKSTIVVILVLIVAAIFLLNPGLLGSGGDGSALSVVPATGATVTIPTDISCNTVQDCVDYAMTQDPDATDVRASCDGTCTYVADKTPVEVEQ